MSFTILTNTGRNKEAALVASGEAMVITEMAWGDGTRIPSGGETSLENEQGRKLVMAKGITEDALNTVFFEILLAEDEGPFVIREVGLFNDDGDLIAIAHYDPPVNKPLDHVSATLRINVVFSNLENLIIQVDPSKSFVPASREIEAGYGLSGGGDLSENRVFEIHPDFRNGSVSSQDDLADADDMDAGSVVQVKGFSEYGDGGDFRGVVMPLAAPHYPGGGRIKPLLEYGAINMAHFGARGGADSTLAFTEALAFAIEECSLGARIIVPPSSNGQAYEVGDLPEISQRSGYNGGFDEPLLGSLQIEAFGAQIIHTGDKDATDVDKSAGVLLRAEGSPTKDNRLILLGGRYEAGDNTRGLFKMRDASQAGFLVEGLQGKDDTEFGVMLQNWFSWSENVAVRGAIGPLRLSRFVDQVVLQTATRAAAYEGIAHEGGTSSFSRFAMSEIFTEGAGQHVADVGGAAYDSRFHNWGGNKSSNAPVIKLRSVHADTVVHSIMLEGANGESDQYVLDASEASTIPTAYNLDWGGSLGAFAPGSLTKDRHFDTNVAMRATEFRDTAGFGVARRAESYSVTCLDGVETELIPSSVFSGNTALDVFVKTTDNTVFGRCTVFRKQGTSTITIEPTFATGIVFGSLGDGLAATQNTGQSQALRVNYTLLTDS